MSEIDDALLEQAVQAALRAEIAWGRAARQAVFTVPAHDQVKRLIKAAWPVMTEQPDCPTEAVFPDGRIPCTLPRNHPGPHTYGDTLLPFDDETGDAT